MTMAFNEHLENEKRINAERTKALITMAHLIAAELGDGWAVLAADPNLEFTQTHPHLRRASDGAEFWLGRDWKDKTKIEVHANWPRDGRGNEVRPHFSQYSDFGPSAPSIAFTERKTSKQAAGDITRRFLSVFLPLWAKQAAVVQGQNQYRDTRKAIAEMVAPIVGGTVTGPRDKHDNTEHGVRIPYDAPHGIYSVEFSGNAKDLRVTLSCSVEELRQIVALLQKDKA